MKFHFLPFAIIFCSISILSACGPKDASKSSATPSAAAACQKIFTFDDAQVEKCQRLSTSEESVLACDQVTGLDAVGKLNCMGVSQSPGVSAQAIRICSVLTGDSKSTPAFSAERFGECLQTFSLKRADLVAGCLNSMSTDANRFACVAAATTGTTVENLKDCQQPFYYNPIQRVFCNYQDCGTLDGHSGLNEFRFNELDQITCLSKGKSRSDYLKCAGDRSFLYSSRPAGPAKVPNDIRDWLLFNCR